MPVGSQMIRDLLENGVHFGHQTNKWNPRMKDYIFGEKSGIYIIDLQKTEQALKNAMDFVYELTKEGKRVLFVGTKKQAKQIIREEATRSEMFYVEERWLGGCLTNFTTIRKSVERLDQIQEMKTSDIYVSLAKKEKARIDREEHKLLKNLEGIREMKELPDCLIAVDAEDEDIAIKEARKIKIPVIGLIDTNCDPTMVDYPVPGNDDAIRSIQYIVSTLADAALKGRNEFMSKKPAVPETKKKMTENTATEEKKDTEAGSDEETSGTVVNVPETDVKTPETVVAGEKTGSEEKKEDLDVTPKEKSIEENKEADAGSEEEIEGDIKLDGAA